MGTGAHGATGSRKQIRLKVPKTHVEPIERVERNSVPGVNMNVKRDEEGGPDHVGNEIVAKRVGEEHVADKRVEAEKVPLELGLVEKGVDIQPANVVVGLVDFLVDAGLLG